ncbi:MAG TPA: hypothetical protein DF699_14770, partial [Phycisphaerales bacterium]|nr:hypothetical protein [Phycisphaerales bacterium]
LICSDAGGLGAYEHRLAGLGSGDIESIDPDPVLGYDIPIGPDTQTGPTVTKARNFGAYLVDTIKFTDAFRVVLGGRLDTFDVDYYSPPSDGFFGPQPAQSLSYSADF